jgi:type IV pilus assembly protein PilA
VNVLSNNKGFSLIELMVVVAIIAILSTIAIPSYQVFQAKSRQKEGFALLGGYFQSAQAARTEYNFFPGNFVGTGFAPVGSLGYRLITTDNGTALPFGQVQDSGCITTAAGTACDCGGSCVDYKEWLECGEAGTTCLAGALAAPNNTIGPVAPATVPAAATANTFLAAAAAVISTKAAAIDEYTINETKSLTMVTDGTK